MNLSMFYLYVKRRRRKFRSLLLLIFFTTLCYNIYKKKQGLKRTIKDNSEVCTTFFIILHFRIVDAKIGQPEMAQIRNKLALYTKQNNEVVFVDDRMSKNGLPASMIKSAYYMEGPKGTTQDCGSVWGFDGSGQVTYDTCKNHTVETSWKFCKLPYKTITSMSTQTAASFNKHCMPNTFASWPLQGVNECILKNETDMIEWVDYARKLDDDLMNDVISNIVGYQIISWRVLGMIIEYDKALLDSGFSLINTTGIPREENATSEYTTATPDQISVSTSSEENVTPAEAPHPKMNPTFSSSSITTPSNLEKSQALPNTILPTPPSSDVVDRATPKESFLTPSGGLITGSDYSWYTFDGDKIVVVSTRPETRTETMLKSVHPTANVDISTSEQPQVSTESVATIQVPETDDTTSDISLMDDNSPSHALYYSMMREIYPELFATKSVSRVPISSTPTTNVMMSSLAYADGPEYEGSADFLEFEHKGGSYTGIVMEDMHKDTQQPTAGPTAATSMNEPLNMPPPTLGPPSGDDMVLFKSLVYKIYGIKLSSMPMPFHDLMKTIEPTMHPRQHSATTEHNIADIDDNMFHPLALEPSVTMPMAIETPEQTASINSPTAIISVSTEAETSRLPSKKEVEEIWSDNFNVSALKDMYNLLLEHISSHDHESEEKKLELYKTMPFSSLYGLSPKPSSTPHTPPKSSTPHHVHEISHVHSDSTTTIEDTSSDSFVTTSPGEIPSITHSVDESGITDGHPTTHALYTTILSTTTNYKTSAASVERAASDEDTSTQAATFTDLTAVSSFDQKMTELTKSHAATTAGPPTTDQAEVMPNLQTMDTQPDILNAQTVDRVVAVPGPTTDRAVTTTISQISANTVPAPSPQATDHTTDRSDTPNSHHAENGGPPKTEPTTKSASTKIIEPTVNYSATMPNPETKEHTTTVRMEQTMTNAAAWQDTHSVHYDTPTFISPVMDFEATTPNPGTADHAETTTGHAVVLDNIPPPDLQNVDPTSTKPHLETVDHTATTQFSQTLHPIATTNSPSRTGMTTGPLVLAGQTVHTTPLFESGTNSDDGPFLQYPRTATYKQHPPTTTSNPAIEVQTTGPPVSASQTGKQGQIRSHAMSPTANPSTRPTDDVTSSATALPTTPMTPSRKHMLKVYSSLDIDPVPATPVPSQAPPASARPVSPPEHTKVPLHHTSVISSNALNISGGYAAETSTVKPGSSLSQNANNVNPNVDVTTSSYIGPSATTKKPKKTKLYELPVYSSLDIDKPPPASVPILHSPTASAKPMFQSTKLYSSSTLPVVTRQPASTIAQVTTQSMVITEHTSLIVTTSTGSKFVTQQEVSVSYKPTSASGTHASTMTESLVQTDPMTTTGDVASPKPPHSSATRFFKPPPSSKAPVPNSMIPGIEGSLGTQPPSSAVVGPDHSGQENSGFNSGSGSGNEDIGSAGFDNQTMDMVTPPAEETTTPGLIETTAAPQPYISTMIDSASLAKVTTPPQHLDTTPDQDQTTQSGGSVPAANFTTMQPAPHETTSSDGWSGHGPATPAEEVESLTTATTPKTPTGPPHSPSTTFETTTANDGPSGMSPTAQPKDEKIASTTDPGVAASLPQRPTQLVTSAGHLAVLQHTTTGSRTTNPPQTTSDGEVGTDELTSLQATLKYSQGYEVTSNTPMASIEPEPVTPLHPSSPSFISPSLESSKATQSESTTEQATASTTTDVSPKTEQPPNFGPVIDIASAVLGKWFEYHLPKTWTDILTSNSLASVTINLTHVEDVQIKEHALVSDRWLAYRPDDGIVCGVPVAKNHTNILQISTFFISLDAEQTQSAPPILLHVSLYTLDKEDLPDYEVTTSVDVTEHAMLGDDALVGEGACTFLDKIDLYLEKTHNGMPRQSINILSYKQAPMVRKKRSSNSLQSLQVSWNMDNTTHSTFASKFRRLLIEDDGKMSYNFFVAMLPQFIVTSVNFTQKPRASFNGIAEPVVIEREMLGLAAILPPVFIGIFLVLSCVGLVMMQRRKGTVYRVTDRLLDKTYGPNRKPIYLNDEIEMDYFRPSRPRIIITDHPDNFMQEFENTSFNSTSAQNGTNQLPKPALSGYGTHSSPDNTDTSSRCSVRFDDIFEEASSSPSEQSQEGYYLFSNGTFYTGKDVNDDISSIWSSSG